MPIVKKIKLSLCFDAVCTITVLLTSGVLFQDCLPLVLMFDLREEDGDVDNSKISTNSRDQHVLFSSAGFSSLALDLNIRLQSL